jgi:hypothetical protein
MHRCNWCLEYPVVSIAPHTSLGAAADTFNRFIMERTGGTTQRLYDLKRQRWLVTFFAPVRAAVVALEGWAANGTVRGPLGQFSLDSFNTFKW